MKLLIKTLLIIIPVIVLNCGSEKQDAFKSKEVYKSNDLVITQITENSFVHTSFLQTNDFGYVSCNVLIVRYNN